MPMLPAWLLRWRAAADPAVISEQTEYDPQRGMVLVAGARDGQVTGGRLAVGGSRAVPSWQADTPAGTWIEILVRADINGRWTRWYRLGEWSTDSALRRSIDGQLDLDGEVATDTLRLHHAARAFQWRVVLHGTAEASPALRSIALAIGPVPEAVADSGSMDAVGPLPVPELSQMWYPGGGPVWCSPTSLTMVLGYWYQRTRASQLAPFADRSAVSEIAAPAVYDPVYEGTGNWAFNTAFAATLGLEGYVLQLRGADDLAQWLTAGVPVAASVAWDVGTLDGAPIDHSDGHLVVVVGITADGDMIVNDPRADTRSGERVRRVYRRAQFLRAWNRSGRTVYLVYPPELIN